MAIGVGKVRLGGGFLVVLLGWDPPLRLLGLPPLLLRLPLHLLGLPLRLQMACCPLVVLPHWCLPPLLGCVPASGLEYLWVQGLEGWRFWMRRQRRYLLPWQSARFCLLLVAKWLLLEEGSSGIFGSGKEGCWRGKARLGLRRFLDKDKGYR